MTDEEKHFHARLNRLLKNAIHLPSPDIIGDVGGTLTRFPVYFFEFDVHADPVHTDLGCRGTLLILISACFSPYIAVYYNMDIEFETDLSMPIELELDNPNCFSDNVELASDLQQIAHPANFRIYELRYTMVNLHTIRIKSMHDASDRLENATRRQTKKRGVDALVTAMLLGRTHMHRHREEVKGRGRGRGRGGGHGRGGGRGGSGGRGGRGGKRQHGDRGRGAAGANKRARTSAPLTKLLQRYN